MTTGTGSDGGRRDSPPCAHPLPFVLGICGFSGAGKTTLIEAVLPELVRRGLAVAVVKHDVHRLEIDRPGKDSDRLFRAGADVFLHGRESFCRLHAGAGISMERELDLLGRHYDLVLVEGYKHTPLPKVWLSGPDGDPPPASVAEVLAVWPRDDRRPQRLLALLDQRLAAAQRQTPVWGCILVGGKSRRMGRAKHLIPHADGTSWVERLAGELAPLVEGIALCGTADIPPALHHLPRLPDPPGVTGPLAGILAACRWQPDTSWLVAACDLPHCDRQALAWLLGQRRPGVWGVIPSTGRPEPLLAWYDFRATPLFEELAGTNEFRPSRLAGHPRIATPEVPAPLCRAWRNCNTPADWHAGGDRTPS